jgi:hypothetical protein
MSSKLLIFCPVITVSAPPKPAVSPRVRNESPVAIVVSVSATTEPVAGFGTSLMKPTVPATASELPPLAAGVTVVTRTTNDVEVRSR